MNDKQKFQRGYHRYTASELGTVWFPYVEAVTAHDKAAEIIRQIHDSLERGEKGMFVYQYYADKARVKSFALEAYKEGNSWYVVMSNVAVNKIAAIVQAVEKRSAFRQKAIALSATQKRILETLEDILKKFEASAVETNYALFYLHYAKDNSIRRFPPPRINAESLMAKNYIAELGCAILNSKGGIIFVEQGGIPIYKITYTGRQMCKTIRRVRRQRRFI